MHRDRTLQGFLRLDWQTYSSITNFFNLYINTIPLSVFNMADPLFSVSLELLCRLHSYPAQLPRSVMQPLT